MPAVSRAEQTSRWLSRAAAALFLVSFFLPAAQVGPPGQQPAKGFLAVILSGFLLPLSVRMLADPPSARPGSFGDTVLALVAGVYFALLLMLNVVMLYGLGAASRKGLRRAERLVTAAAILVWGVPFLDYERIYRALSLARGEAFELRVGFFLWAASFAVLAVALRGRTATFRDSPEGAG